MNLKMVLENKLRDMEFELAIANEKLAIFDDKIKDKNEIIEALKMSNNLYKSDYKDRFDAQASIIEKLEEELSTLRKAKLNSSQDLETNNNKSKLRSTIFFRKESEKEKKLLISSLEAQIKEKAKTERENSQLIKSLKSQIGDNDVKLKDKQDLIATLEARLKESDSKNIENEHMIQSLSVKMCRIISEEKEYKSLIATLKNQIGQKSETLEKNKGIITSLKAQIKEKDKINGENSKVIANHKAQIKEKDDQITYLELGLSLETCKTREKDELLNDQAATIMKLQSNQERVKETHKLIPSEGQQISNAL